MCISREHFNLCTCGCPEIVHEDPPILQVCIASEYGLTPPTRGKCLGDIPLLLSVEEIRKLIEEAKERGEERVALTKPCDCKKFDPIFKPMCTGFGA